MVSEIFNNNTQNSLNKSLLIPVAHAIIAISEQTKRDILNFYPNLSPNKITVIHHGVTQMKFESISNQYGNYILFVGGREGYKNFNNFFKAIVPILKNDKTLNLVCTGSSFNKIELQMINDAMLHMQCYSVYVNDIELNSLYKHARVFVFPSFYEGFGLPILEAFVNECPICISNASCFPEIAGDAAVYFDPNSTDSIKNSIERVIDDPELSNFLRDRGRERVKDFSWEKSAKLHFDLYKSLMH
jgi:glycosyltransferase involved in cell wall biosynthesis